MLILLTVDQGLPFSKKQATRRRQETEAPAAVQNEHPVYHKDPCIQRIVEVLGDLHAVRIIWLSVAERLILTSILVPQVVVQNVINKFEGLREEVRTGRDELLRRAADDLHAIRAERYVISSHYSSRHIDVEPWCLGFAASRISTALSTWRRSTPLWAETSSMERRTG